MTYMDYFSGNGEPVGMYVEYIHKDTSFLYDYQMLKANHNK